MNIHFVSKIALRATILAALTVSVWADGATQKRIPALYQQTLAFEPDPGAGVQYRARGDASSIFLEAGRATVALGHGASVGIRFEGANPTPGVEALDPAPGTVSYFGGKGSSEWRTGVRRYGKVRYRDVYPGIDVVYYGNERNLEFDFVVAPGADPRAIRIAYTGPAGARIDESGDLRLAARGFEIRQHRPTIYQERNGKREAVDGRYALEGGVARFALARYDTTRPLVIDPVLSYSTYLGGSDTDTAVGITADANGNTYVTGTTMSQDFPRTSGAYNNTSDCGVTSYISKIDPTGKNLLYSAYFYCGEAKAITVDATGAVYLTGYSRGGFPVTDGAIAGADEGGAFITKLSPDGTKLIYSTVIPGNNENPVGIAIDAAGAAYITGNGSGYLKTTSGAFQPRWNCGDSQCGFVVKVKPDGKSEAYATFIQTDDNGIKMTGIAVDAAGQAWVTGYTRGRNLPTTPNAPYKQPTDVDSGFVVELNATGTSALLCTYLGGAAQNSKGIAIDRAGYVYVAGEHDTQWPDLPTTPGAYKSTCVRNENCGAVSFVTKMDGTGKVIYTTLVGSVETVDAIGVDAAGNVAISGTADYVYPNPTTPDAIKSKTDYSQGTDIYVTKLNAAGSALLYSTYFGGTGEERVAAVFVSPGGDIYVTGDTESKDLTLTPGNIQQTKAPGGGKNWDTFVLKIVEPAAPQFTAEGIVNAANFKGGAIAAGEIITIFGTGIGPTPLANYHMTGSFFDTTVGQTRILFDGVAAPIIYAYSGSTSVVVPYTAAGKTSVQIVAEYQGRQSAPVTVPVTKVAPGIFTTLANGTGQAAVLNKDYSVNGPTNRAVRGDYVSVFLTSGGESGVDGMVAQGAQQAPLNVTAKVDGIDAQVIYTGPTPGCIWGLTQVNLIIPMSARVSGADSLVITINGVETQGSVTIGVQ